MLLPNDAVQRVAVLGRLVAEGESYSDVLGLLASSALRAGWWDGADEEPLARALADAAEAVDAGRDPLAAVRRVLAPDPARDRAESLAGTLARIAEALHEAVMDATLWAMIRREWEAGKAAVEAAHPPGSKARRKALADLRGRMHLAYGPAWTEPGRRVLLPIPAGAGKTTMTGKEIARFLARLGVAWFLMPTTANAVEAAAANPDGTAVRGRSAPNPEAADGGSMCLRPALAERVAAAGLPVAPTLCDNGQGKVCPFKADGSCPYQRKAAENRAAEVGLFYGPLEYLFTRGAPMPRPDFVVIDERFLEKARTEIRLGLDRLTVAEMEGWQRAGRDMKAAREYRRIMAAIHAAALADPANLLREVRARGLCRPEDFRPALDYLDAVEERDFTGGITPDMPEAEILDRMDRLQRSELGKLRALLDALAAEIALPRDVAHAVTFDPACPVTVEGRTELQARLTIQRRRRLEIAEGVPLLMLDASADPELARRLVGDRLEIIGAELERNARIIQITDTAMPASALLGTRRNGKPLSPTSVAKAEQRLARVAAVANALARRHGGLLLVATKRVREALEPLLAPEVRTAHFGALRGRNEWGECPAALVVGREQPPPREMEALARPIYAADPEPLNLPGAYVHATRHIRLKDGSAVAVKVQVHPDPRVQQILEQFRERESEQAVDRLRLIHNPETKAVYLMSNVPLRMAVDAVTTERELMHETTGQMDNGRTGKGRRLNGCRLTEAWRRGGGVLPLSHRVLARLWPDLWASERRAREDLERVPSWQREVLFAETAHLPAEVSYRLPGQRCPSRALVADPATGRAALEALVGPLAAYEAPADPRQPAPMPAVEDGGGLPAGQERVGTIPIREPSIGECPRLPTPPAEPFFYDGITAPDMPPPAPPVAAGEAGATGEACTPAVLQPAPAALPAAPGGLLAVALARGARVTFRPGAAVVRPQGDPLAALRRAEAVQRERAAWLAEAAALAARARGEAPRAG